MSNEPSSSDLDPHHTRRVDVLVLILLGLASISLFFPNAHAQSIQSVNWNGAFYIGWDPYYETTVKAYTVGSIVTVSVLFEAFGTVSVSAVKLTMDWGQNYTAAGMFPQTLNAGAGNNQYRITFTAPDLSVATNSFAHSGKAIVEFTPFGGTSTASVINACGFGTCFVIYSPDQASDVSLMRRFSQPTQTGVSLSCGALSGFTTQQANSFCLQASKELTAGTTSYQGGDFSGAKVHLQNANNLMDNAASVQSFYAPWGDLANTVGGWGLLLLGISALATVVLLVTRRPYGIRGESSRMTEASKSSNEGIRK